MDAIYSCVDSSLRQLPWRPLPCSPVPEPLDCAGTTEEIKTAHATNIIPQKGVTEPRNHGPACEHKGQKTHSLWKITSSAFTWDVLKLFDTNK